MKVGRPSWIPAEETLLPSEIIELILAFVSIESSPGVRQQCLWSCCLLSKQWYSTTIPLLYHSPLLTGRNFTEFARTMCPPINARIPMIGLEDCVHHLDMSRLAYEPRKSITARLIRRTKQSLETFLAPAVSFSVNCLAPLSKCTELKILDLSRDRYDISLKQLLSSISQLKDLWYLSLPKAIIDHDTVVTDFPTKKSSSNVWPSSLRHLILNQSAPRSTENWDAFLSTLPSSLHSLALTDQVNVNPLRHIIVSEQTKALNQITSLMVSSRGKPPAALLSDMVASFPNVKTLEVSGVTRWMFRTSPPEYFASLEYVVLQYSPDFVSLSHIVPSYLLEFVEHCPNLIRIDVPESYVDYEQDQDGTITDQLNDVMDERAEARAKSGIPIKDYGIILTEVENTGTGLRRSLQYPEG